MGRPPCCDKVGIKKGPWTPEEDIILVSYIQEHGPGNWRSVPTNTGLLRCSKSCRLRWTNYLRPGIKRGNFTAHEEGMIIHLQALLGNKWAAIASYLPQRTDNDIKNYWNTHLKKKLKKFQSALDPMAAAAANDPTTATSFVSKSFSERSTSLDLSPNSSSTFRFNHQSSSSTITAPYASSTENISRLLEGWMRSSPKTDNNRVIINQNDGGSRSSIGNNSMAGTAYSLQCYRPKTTAEQENGGHDLISHEEFESILSFENLNNIAWDHHIKSTCDSTTFSTIKDTSHHQESSASRQEKENIITENEKQKSSSDHQNNNPPLSLLEKWLLDESGAAAAQVEESMELSPIF